MNGRKLELLSPAANAATAFQAILHGADAIYIGPPSFGARKAASNSIDEIAKVVEFAHIFRAKVYATVNTIVYDNEIREVEKLCRQLYNIGVDALIVQDMGLLRMDLPPIALHASTQCDIRTPEKALFLQEAGFSQLVLARELSIPEIKEITNVVSIPVETFVHGALCVSYSGRCHASHALTGRSANRGECAQICRLPYTLTDSDNRIICKDKYLLSLKDFNVSNNLKDLIDAGVSSFKIEGRLKDIGYVKNITALFNTQLNNLISQYPENYMRSSFGKTILNFSPEASKSFNRGFTNYFLEDRQPLRIASLDTPKSKGEIIKNISDLNNGDGISFFDTKKGEFTGVNINRVEKNKIIPARKIEIPKNVPLYRTFDVKWEKNLNSETAIRKIPLDIIINNENIIGRDERGVEVTISMKDIPFEKAKNPMNYSQFLSKLGNTNYILRSLEYNLDSERFYPTSVINDLRRRLIAALDEKNTADYTFDKRRSENQDYPFPYTQLDYRDNVANHLAKEFYLQHGVTYIEEAAEISGKMKKGNVVMNTRHCILRELGLCKKEKRVPKNFREPLFLTYDGGKFQLEFDCRQCEMKVLL